MNISPGASTRSPRPRVAALVPLLIAASFAVVGVSVTSAQAAPPPAAPDLGPNVHVIDPSMSLADIQTVVDGVAAAQLGNQFGERRDSILFMPGTYGTAEAPLNFQVGYYTEVAGLGRNPGDVVINGSINVFNQCTDGNCIALNNFWRTLSNLTIDVTPGTDPQYSGCHGGEFWAVSQASPMRRVQINGQGHNITLMDYCSNPSFASGGFIADSRFDSAVINGSQQQFFTRNSALDGGWSNGVWNQVFSGTTGAPAEAFAAPNYYTTLDATPASREKPYLYVDGNGTWQVFVPDAATNSSGPTWSSDSDTAGRSIPLYQFYVAKPTDSVTKLNKQLSLGQNLLLTPGVYSATAPIQVNRAGTVVLGLGLATLTSANTGPSLQVGDVAGVDIAGLILDAGPKYSSSLLQIGSKPHARTTLPQYGPTSLQDVFFRTGGPHAGRAAVSLEVNSDNVILDDIWAWRADHGTGVGWNSNIAPTGLKVTGNDVTATGLFVEHYQQYEVAWSGQRGKVVFFQNEMPYDVPSQNAWTSDGRTPGYAALEVLPGVTDFQGYGMGSYSFFNQGLPIYAARAFEVPKTAGVHLHDLLTIFLDATNGSGGIKQVVNNVGGPSTAANADTPVTVVDYPAPVAAR